ncbi:MAG: hypothetical protein U1F10_09560 [Burkholderiales bacterium]
MQVTNPQRTAARNTHEGFAMTLRYDNTLFLILLVVTLAGQLALLA